MKTNNFVCPKSAEIKLINGYDLVITCISVGQVILHLQFEPLRSSHVSMTEP